MAQQKSTVNYLKIIFFIFISLPATKAYSSGDWWSGTEKQSYNKNNVLIGTNLYKGEGELVLSCHGGEIKADITLRKSRVSSGIVFKITVDNGAWIKNGNRPEYTNSFTTYMFHHLVDDMKKGREIHIDIIGHRRYSASLIGFTNESKKLSCI